MKEKHITKLVQNFLEENKGYTIYKNAKKRLEWKVGIGRETQVTYEPDVVGFRWRRDEEIDAVAVECKIAKNAKNVLSALSQATVYQNFFPKTYIATNFSIKNVAEVRKILKKRGFGYLYINPRKKVVEELKPIPSGCLLDRNLYKLFVKRKAAIFLASQENCVLNKIREIGQQRASFLTGTGLSALGLWVAFEYSNQIQPFHVSIDDIPRSRLKSEKGFHCGLHLHAKNRLRRLLKLDSERVWTEIEKLPKGYFFNFVEWNRKKRKYITHLDRKITRENYKKLREKLAMVKYKRPGRSFMFEIVRWFEWRKVRLERSFLVRLLKKTLDDLEPFICFLIQNI